MRGVDFSNTGDHISYDIGLATLPDKRDLVQYAASGVLAYWTRASAAEEGGESCDQSGNGSGNVTAWPIAKSWTEKGYEHVSVR